MKVVKLARFQLQNTTVDFQRFVVPFSGRKEESRFINLVVLFAISQKFALFIETGCYQLNQKHLQSCELVMSLENQPYKRVFVKKFYRLQEKCNLEFDENSNNIL